MYHFEVQFGLPWVLHHCQLNTVSKMAAKTINWTFAHVLVFQHCYKEPSMLPTYQSEMRLNSYGSNISVK